MPIVPLDGGQAFLSRAARPALSSAHSLAAVAVGRTGDSRSVCRQAEGVARDCNFVSAPRFVCLFVCVRAAQRQNPSSSILRRIRENEMNKKTKYETGDLAWNVCSGRVFFFFFFFFQFPSLESDFRNHHRPHVWKPLFLANAFTISPQMTRLRVACGLRAPLASAYPPR